MEPIERQLSRDRSIGDVGIKRTKVWHLRDWTLCFAVSPYQGDYLMSCTSPGEIAAGLAELSHRDRRRIARKAAQMRAEAITELIRAVGRAIMRMGRAVTAPPVPRSAG
jgi:hypothetical protein